MATYSLLDQLREWNALGGIYPTTPDINIDIPSIETLLPGAYETFSGSAGEATDIAQQVSSELLRQIQEQLGAQVPNYPELTQQRSDIISSELRGELPADVESQIAQAAAERGIQIGAPLSENVNAELLRALGLTSLQMQQSGLSNLLQAIQGARVQPYFPEQAMISPLEYINYESQRELIPQILEALLKTQTQQARALQQSALGARPSQRQSTPSGPNLGDLLNNLMEAIARSGLGRGTGLGGLGLGGLGRGALGPEAFARTTGAGGPLGMGYREGGREGGLDEALQQAQEGGLGYTSPYEDWGFLDELYNYYPDLIYLVPELQDWYELGIPPTGQDWISDVLDIAPDTWWQFPELYDWAFGGLGEQYWQEYGADWYTPEDYGWSDWADWYAPEEYEDYGWSDWADWYAPEDYEGYDWSDSYAPEEYDWSDWGDWYWD